MQCWWYHLSNQFIVLLQFHLLINCPMSSNMVSDAIKDFWSFLSSVVALSLMILLRSNDLVLIAHLLVFFYCCIASLFLLQFVAWSPFIVEIIIDCVLYSFLFLSFVLLLQLFFFLLFLIICFLCWSSVCQYV